MKLEIVQPPLTIDDKPVYISKIKLMWLTAPQEFIDRLEAQGISAIFIQDKPHGRWETVSGKNGNITRLRRVSPEITVGFLYTEKLHLQIKLMME